MYKVNKFLCFSVLGFITTPVFSQQIDTIQFEKLIFLKFNPLQLLIGEVRTEIEYWFPQHGNIELGVSVYFSDPVTVSYGAYSYGYKIIAGFNVYFSDFNEIKRSYFYLHPMFFYKKKYLGNLYNDCWLNEPVFFCGEKTSGSYIHSKEIDVYSLQLMFGFLIKSTEKFFIDVYWGVGGRYKEVYKSRGSYDFNNEIFLPSINLGVNLVFLLLKK